ncbi:MAG: hypothetical protein WAS33_09235, partial [Candidatus Promineifilaceae bacterium]
RKCGSDWQSDLRFSLLVPLIFHAWWSTAVGVSSCKSNKNQRLIVANKNKKARSATMRFGQK